MCGSLVDNRRRKADILHIPAELGRPAVAIADRLDITCDLVLLHGLPQRIQPQVVLLRPAGWVVAGGHVLEVDVVKEVVYHGADFVGSFSVTRPLGLDGARNNGLVGVLDQRLDHIRCGLLIPRQILLAKDLRHLIRPLPHWCATSRDRQSLGEPLAQTPVQIVVDTPASGPEVDESFELVLLGRVLVVYGFRCALHQFLNFWL